MSFWGDALTTASGRNLVRAEVNRSKRAALWAVAPTEIAEVFVPTHSEKSHSSAGWHDFMSSGGPYGGTGFCPASHTRQSSCSSYRVILSSSFGALECFKPLQSRISLQISIESIPVLERFVYSIRAFASLYIKIKNKQNSARFCYEFLGTLRFDSWNGGTVPLFQSPMTVSE